MTDQAEKKGTGIAIKEGDKASVKEETKGREDQAKAAEKAAPVGAAPEVQAEALKKAGVQPGTSSASAIAAAGSPPGEETAGAGPDIGGGNSSAQTEPAIMTPSGSLPHGFVSSPSGPVPASAAGGAAALVEYGKKLAAEGKAKGPRKHERLTEDRVRGLSKASIRAVATDRGYDLGPEAGRQAMASAFLKAQAADDYVEDEAPQEDSKTTNYGPDSYPPTLKE